MFPVMYHGEEPAARTAVVVFCARRWSLASVRSDDRRARVTMALHAMVLGGLPGERALACLRRLLDRLVER